MIARIALWEPPMTAIVRASLRGSISARRLGLRTVSRFSSFRFVVDDVPAADGYGEERDFGDEPVQRIRRGVETSMFVEDGSVGLIRTVHLDFYTTLAYISPIPSTITYVIFKIGTHHFPPKRRNLFHLQQARRKIFNHISRIVQRARLVLIQFVHDRERIRRLGGLCYVAEWLDACGV